MGLAVDDETGAPVEIFATRRGISVARGLDRLESVSKNVVLVDALAFSVVPSDEKSYMLPLQEMAPFLCLGTIDHRPSTNAKACFGLRYSARFSDGAGMVAWGGESKKGRVYFSLMERAVRWFKTRQ